MYSFVMYSFVIYSSSHELTASSENTQIPEIDNLDNKFIVLLLWFNYDKYKPTSINYEENSKKYASY